MKWYKSRSFIIKNYILCLVKTEKLFRKKFEIIKRFLVIQVNK